MFRKKIYLAIWFICSLIFVIPRFGYFHLQHAAAFFCLLFPQLFIKQKKISKYLIVLYLIGVLALFIKFISREYNQPVRFFEPDIIKTRLLIEKNISTLQPVFFYNVSSEYFVGSKLTLIKPWAYEFPWYMEVPGVQEKIVNSLESNKTNTVVFMNHRNEGKYVPGSYIPKIIESYISSHYVISNKITDSILILHRIPDQK